MIQNVIVLTMQYTIKSIHIQLMAKSHFSRADGNSLEKLIHTKSEGSVASLYQEK